MLHSLPRMDELPPDVDGTRHARYWNEAFNGVWCGWSCWRWCWGRWNRRKDTTMQTNLRGRDLITDQEWTREELETVLDVAFDLKRKRALGEPHPPA